MNNEKIDVLAVMKLAAERAFADRDGANIELHLGICRAHDVIHVLVGASDRLVKTLSIDGLVKPSSKNPNAGFIDMRDWYALQGEVNELRAALARIGAQS